MTPVADGAGVYVTAGAVGVTVTVEYRTVGTQVEMVMVLKTGLDDGAYDGTPIALEVA
jgi:hypothetical protein